MIYNLHSKENQIEMGMTFGQTDGTKAAAGLEAKKM